MPQPEHRPACVIAGDLGQARVWELADKGLTLVLTCDNCHHKADWPPDVLSRKLARHKAARLVNAVHKLRCGRCRSNYLHLWVKG